jgi:hypothetical protein
MAREDITATALEVREQYLSLVYHKIPGEAAWTLIHQGRTLSPDVQAEEKNYMRIGDKNQTTKYGTAKTTVSFELYAENDIEEIARVLGVTTLVNGTVVQLDPTQISDLAIVNFDGITTAAAVLFTEYINRFAPGQLSPPLEAEGDARLFNVSGAADAYYIIYGSTSFTVGP